IVGAERSHGCVDFYAIALCGHVSALGDAIADDADRGDAEDSNADDHGDNDQNDFESAAASGWGCGRWRGRCGSGRACGLDGTAFIAELCSLSQSCAAGIAECHKSPPKRVVDEATARVYRKLRAETALRRQLAAIFSFSAFAASSNGQKKRVPLRQELTSAAEAALV